MSDEIEIEEHDLLDDPTVRNIFPDISRLKQEILGYDYVEAPDFGNTETTSSQLDSYDGNLSSTENSADIVESKIILPGNIEHNSPNDGPHNGFIRRDKGIKIKICNNKIILGSKPVNSDDSNVEHFEKNVKPYCAVVVLEDFGIYLNSSARYCQHCQILFPTNSDYNHHVEDIHKELVNTTDSVDDKIIVRTEFSDENKEIEANESKHVQKKNEKIVKFGINGEAICLICNAQLAYRRNMGTHLFQVHKISKEKIKEVMRKKNSEPHTKGELTSTVKRNECFHCKKSFRTQNLLIEHIYSILQNPKNGSDRYANKILIGNKTNNSELNSSVTPENRNLGLMDMPNKNIQNTNFENNSTTEHVMRFFKCRFCLLYFKTTKYFFRHMRIKHKMVNNFQIAKVSFDPKCKYCPKVNDQVDIYNAHLRKNHPKQVQEAIEKSRKLLVNSNKGKINIVSKEISQNAFYRCDFCCLYFNNLTFFMRHVTIKHKVMKMPKPKKVAFEPKCKYCPGTYTNARRYNMHLRKSHYIKCNQVVDKSQLTTSVARESNLVDNTSNIQNVKKQVYRCKLCPLYFKTTNWFIRHLNNKHKVKTIPVMATETFNPKCKYCPRLLDTVTKYNDHLTKCHSALLSKLIVRSESAKVIKKIKVNMKPKFPKLNSNKGETSTDFARQSQKKFEHKAKIKRLNTQCQKTINGYTCKFCPIFFKSMKFYGKHVKTRHKLDTVPKLKMVTFDLKCKLCSVVLSNIKIYNRHVYNVHYTEIARKPNLEKKDSRQNMETTKTALETKEKRFYRCCYCSYYFNNIGIYKSHVVRKHKVQLPNDAQRIEFDPHCKYCPLEAANEIAYNKHLGNCHKNRVNEVFTGRSKQKINLNKACVSKNTSTSSVSTSLQESRKPMDDNMVSSNITPILKSALFKCNKCDIHFLSVKTASDHLNHMELLVNWKCSLCSRIFKDNDKGLHEKQHLLSDVFTVYDLNTTSHILYKCSKCNLHYDESVDNHHKQCILKIPESYTCEICKILIDCNSKICHEYNHKHRDLTSNDFIVIETDVLFDTDNMFISDKNNALIVDTEGNLIDESQHHNKQINNLKRKNKNVENSEVKIQPKKVKRNDAECSKNNLEDIVYKEKYSNSVTKNQQKMDKMLLKLSFCTTCKSFVSVIGRKRKEHAQGLCANLPTLVCKTCGLRFSWKTLRTHEQVHLRVKKLELQSFKFYAFNSGKRTMPPMPEYEKCGICETNFISKSTLGQHVCSDNKYKLCEICNIKLFTPIFNLHMAFHKYKIDGATSSSASNNAVICAKPEEIQKANETVLLLLYCCKVCNIYMDTYDRLIEHCHKHSLDSLPKYMEECKVCKLKFDDNSLKTHRKLHETLGSPTFDKLFFDPFYFRFENKIWLNHVFGSYPKMKVQDVILSSRYRNEHRFVLHIVQEGRFDLTLYKCDKCNLYVEPDIIYHHIENSCSNLRKYPCPVCHLDFISSFSLTRHKRTHEDPKITLKSYRIISFNKQEDADLNAVIFSPPKLYVIYQCRHCNGVIDSIHRMSHVCDRNTLKSCTDCGLLITEDVYERHVSKHKTLDSYIAENMKVILFGPFELHEKKLNSMPTTNFRGKIHDYSFYKCRDCHICVKHKKSTTTHTCCFKSSRVSCSKCGLYFNSDKLVSHTKSHSIDPDFILENMNIIEFCPTIHKPKDDELTGIGIINDKECSDEIGRVDVNGTSQESNVSQQNIVPDTTEATNEVEKVTDIYKCSCGLHFIDESSVLEHFTQCGSKAKQAKQNCSKCGLLFTPTVLFKHLLSHHGDKLIKYKFNVIEKSKT
ncbi:uncharacterized protein LOC128673629 [Plodia interpunctella]|uniref:uncharacterized protein LOC128673629 n=1 Tax=Plodia interpunctella TaxID=58824 RepID=UPI002367F977|nr:uncharacterized protein LOC128673629 [Plodia interpunctella]XP_053607577.1 uncharacterized protein LOC128673629 [Plodia interpunctella]